MLGFVTDNGLFFKMLDFTENARVFTFRLEVFGPNGRALAGIRPGQSVRDFDLISERFFTESSTTVVTVPCISDLSVENTVENSDMSEEKR